MKSVLITGSSQGIGRAIAKKLNNKYKLILAYKESEKEALDLLYDLRKTNPNVIAVRADVSKEGDVDLLFKKAEENFSQVDILINNAGISKISLLQDMTYQDREEVIGVNLSSVFLTSKRALPSMLEKKEGVILNISSIRGSQGASMEVAYSASKGGVDSFTRSLAKEVGPSNIRVNAIAPGIVDTPMMERDFSKETREALKEDLLYNRFARPCEVADLASFLISDAASYITGEVIGINGGFY